MTDNSKEWMAFEEAKDFIASDRRRLKDGSEGAGATLTLTPDECLKLLLQTIPPKKPASREPKSNNVASKLYCLWLQRGGMSPSDAVAETSKRFGCSKWTVNTACRLRALKK